MNHVLFYNFKGSKESLKHVFKRFRGGIDCVARAFFGTVFCSTNESILAGADVDAPVKK